MSAILSQLLNMTYPMDMRRLHRSFHCCALLLSSHFSSLSPCLCQFRNPSTSSSFPRLLIRQLICKSYYLDNKVIKSHWWATNIPSHLYTTKKKLTFPIPYCIMQECFLALNSPSEPAPLQGSWETSLSWEKWRIQTLQKVRGRAPSSATLHSLKRFAGMHIFHSSPSIVSQVWKDLHQNIRARSHTSVPWDPDTVLGRKSSWKAGFES